MQAVTDLRRGIYLWLLAVLALAVWLSCSRSVAASYPSGTVVDGYTYHADRYGYRSYYWKGYDAYTRSYYQPPGYYQYGYYYQPPGYYQYSFSHTYTPPATPALPPTPPADWRSRLLELAAARDKVEGDLRKGAIEQQQYLDAIRALGLQGNFTWQGYGQMVPYGSPGYGQYNQLSLGTYGAQGQSVYGYSYNSIAQLYGDTNLAQLYQSANRLAENQQKLAGQATTDFSALVGQEGSNRARVAEILAKGQQAREILQALEGSSSKVQIQQQTFKLVPNGGQPLPGGSTTPYMPPVKDEAPIPQATLGRQVLLAYLQKECLECHGDSKKIKRQDPFIVGDWDGYSKEAKKAVYDRLVTTNEDERMPRLKSGGAGPKCPPEIAKLILTS